MAGFQNKIGDWVGRQNAVANNINYEVFWGTKKL
jgi:hypothetical protein